MGSAAHPASSITPMAPTSMTWMARPTWITSVPGAPCCWVTTTRPSRLPSSRPSRKGWATAPPPRSKCWWPRRYARSSPPWSRCGWSTPAPRQPWAPSGWPAATPVATRSSNSKAATTATPTPCWSRQAPAPWPWANPTARACRPTSPSTLSPVSITIWTRCARPSPSTAARSPASSSSRWLATWIAFRRSPASWKGCAPFVTSSAPCWSWTRWWPVFASPCAAPRGTTISIRIWPPSARSSGPACRWGPSAARRRWCSTSPRPAPSIRRAPSPATRWPWPPAWPCWICCWSRASMNSWVPRQPGLQKGWKPQLPNTASRSPSTMSAACSASSSPTSPRSPATSR